MMYFKQKETDILYCQLHKNSYVNVLQLTWSNSALTSILMLFIISHVYLKYQYILIYKIIVGLVLLQYL